MKLQSEMLPWMTPSASEAGLGQSLMGYDFRSVQELRRARASARSALREVWKDSTSVTAASAGAYAPTTTSPKGQAICPE